MLPYKNKHPLRSVGIPSLSGGVNLRDGLTQVNDNQLTDVKNMWFKDGMLKTRPGVVLEAQDNPKKYFYFDGRTTQMKAQETEIYRTVKDKETGNIYKYRLFTYRYEAREENQNGNMWDVPKIAFYWVCDKKGTVEYGGEISSNAYHYFVIQHNGKLYCFCNDRNIFTCDISFTLNEKGKETTEFNTEWKTLTNEDMYAPLVMTRCKPLRGGLGMSGVQVEGYNLLTNSYKMIYSTINLEEEIHPMRYNFAQPLIEGKSATVTAKITAREEKENGEVSMTTTTHTVLWEGDITKTYYEAKEKDREKDTDQFRCFINQGYLMFEDVKKGNVDVQDDLYGKYVIFELDSKFFVENNLEIIVRSNNTDSNANKVFGMTRAEWFGGASAGLNGGTRLFLGGNVNENEQSLVIWSDLNNLLYFPENNYVYVGNANIPVTGFGKQNDMLVIFKSSEIFATQYVQNSGITAESLINQSMVDIAANSVYFPLIQIHSSVGCDLPDTVCLCRNRLVWAAKTGKVYTLVSQSQYNERNVFEISQMIERKLKGALNEYAHAVDYDGHYMLFCGNKAFVCDYNSYGYIYTASHSKTEDANIRIPWYYWEFENKVHSVLVVGDKLYIVDYNEEKTDDEPPYITTVYFNLLDYEKSYDKNGHTTAEHPIKTSFTTKAFDFGSSAYEKHIPQVHIAFGDNGNEPINISFVTDKGEAAGETVYIPSDESSMRDSTYLKSTVIRPNVRFVRHFGIKAECEGAMAVGDVSINYRIQGEVK